MQEKLEKVIYCITLFSEKRYQSLGKNVAMSFDRRVLIILRIITFLNCRVTHVSLSFYDSPFHQSFRYSQHKNSFGGFFFQNSQTNLHFHLQNLSLMLIQKRYFKIQFETDFL